MRYSKVEQAIVTFLLKGESPALHALRIQRENSEIESVENNVVGLYINYTQTEYSGPRFDSDISFGDIEIKFEGNNDLFGAIIFTKEGVISSMEIYSTGDGFPENIDEPLMQYRCESRDYSEIEKSYTHLS